jgi:hypothetical protein
MRGEILQNKHEEHVVVAATGKNQGWIQHDLVGGVLCQLWCRVVSVMCAARPSTCLLLQSLLDYCIWIVIVVHSSLIIMLLHKLLYLILSLIFFALSWKIAPPCLQPLWPGLGGGGAVNPPLVKIALILKWVKLQSLVVKCCKMRKITNYKFCILLYCVRKLLPFSAQMW